MAYISQTKFQMKFLLKKIEILVQDDCNFVPKGPIDNRSSLVHQVQVMAWCRTSNKLLP